jgi:hypothetical protein
VCFLLHCPLHVQALISQRPSATFRPPRRWLAAVQLRNLSCSLEPLRRTISLVGLMTRRGLDAGTNRCNVSPRPLSRRRWINALSGSAAWNPPNLAWMQR